MATMNVSLPEAMKEWVDAQARSGRYGNCCGRRARRRWRGVRKRTYRTTRRADRDTPDRGHLPF